MVEDAAHAAGAEYEGARIGSHGHAVCFSFYAIKNMTTGEGGMITTNDDALAQRLRLLSLHGMSRDAWKRYTEAGSWYYEVLEPGYKYNMTDIQAALGIHQLRRLDGFIRRRQEIAAMYDEAFSGSARDPPASAAARQESHVSSVSDSAPERRLLAVEPVGIHRRAAWPQHRRQRSFHSAAPAPVLPRPVRLPPGAVPGLRRDIIKGCCRFRSIPK